MSEQLLDAVVVMDDAEDGRSAIELMLVHVAREAALAVVGRVAAAGHPGLASELRGTVRGWEGGQGGA